MSKTLKTAFVAMKFDGDHWRDRRYAIISRVLREAGFRAIRADQIQTSGPSASEICKYLELADLVVIDGTGGSHSVSYEIGYCHGAKRPVEKTLLLTQDTNIPFNYRHYRHRIYRNLRHLSHVLRDSLDLTFPLKDDQYGYAFTFEFKPGAIGYILDGAICIFKGLEQLKFTGRCECYSGEHFALGRLYTVAVALRKFGTEPTPTYDWWMKLRKRVIQNVEAGVYDIKYQENGSEMATLAAMRHDLIPCGVAEFRNGKITHVIGDSDDGENFFSSYLNP